MRPTEEVDPSMLRQLLAKQRRLATGSDQQKPEPRPTVQISKEELLGLREECSDAPVIQIVEEPVFPPYPEPRARKVVIGAAIACLATVWLAACGWLLATW